MRWPELVPAAVCTVPVHVRIESEGLSEQGEPIILVDKDCRCNYQDNAYRILDEQQKLIVLNGKAYFNGDIAPDVSALTGGEIKVFGVVRRIYRGTKARNPDGSVNYTLLEIV